MRCVMRLVALAACTWAVVASVPPVAATPSEARSVTIALPGVQQNMALGFGFDVSIGGGPPHRVLVDTGSIGLVVARTTLGPEAVDTGASGRVEYTSSGKVFYGEYFRAAIVLVVGSGSYGPRAQTVPIDVLAVDRQTCDPQYPSCTIDQDLGTVGVLGVGFDRDTGAPAVNPFLQLTAVRAGRMTPGYIVAADHVTLGITSENSRGFDFISLKPNPNTPGDWLAAPGCYGFPAIAGAGDGCGTILIDTGISGMILREPVSRRPPGLSDGTSTPLPAGTIVRIVAPKPSAPVLSYQFMYQPSTTPDPPMAPTSIRWSSVGNSVFVNTGRDVLVRYDYLYDARRGRVGFRVRGAMP